MRDRRHTPRRRMVRTSWWPRHVLLPVGLASVLLTLVVTLVAGDRHVAAQPVPASARLLTAAEVAGAFRVAGLAVNDLRQEPVSRRSPTGPPQTEREAWRFSVPGLAPSGGRILVFTDDDKLQKKAAWFKRVGAGAAVLAHRNVILWLDPALAPSEAARYRQVLQGLR